LFSHLYIRLYLRIQRELNNQIKHFDKSFEDVFIFLAMQEDQTLKAIRYQRGSLSILDQLKLPDVSVYMPIITVDDAWKAIHTMSIRGINKST
jgi:hypothetical protein